MRFFRRCGGGAVLFGLLVWALLTVSALAPAEASAGPPPLRLGIGGDPLLATGTSAARTAWIGRAARVGASIVRVNVLWSQVARVRPTIPDDPTSPGYDWSAVDSAVQGLTSRGLDVMLMLYRAPRWAEGANRPAAAADGSWRPDPKAFAQFATAAAIRYDGHTPEPGHLGAFLPRVRYWQAWNEPNLDQYLSPQRVKAGSGERTVGPGLYRPLLNGFYASVKRVSSSNYVVTGGTTSFGNAHKSLGKQATAPVAFYRMLFCLQGRQALKPVGGCPAVNLDAIDHHPYNAAGPARHSTGADGVAYPDIWKIARVLRAALAAGHAAPRGNKGLWVTEMAWSSSPPASNGVPMTVDAHWYELALYTLWRQGVHVIMPLELGDPGMFPGQPQVLQGGLYFHDGAAKPIAAACRFPFVIASAGAGQVQAWGRSPRAGRLAIEVHTPRGWIVLRTLTVGRWQVFKTSLAHHGNSTWRATVGPDVSLNWRQGAYTRR